VLAEDPVLEWVGVAAIRRVNPVSHWALGRGNK